MYFKLLELYIGKKFLLILQFEFILYFSCCVKNIFLTILDLFLQNQICEIVDLPPSAKPISCK